MIFCMLLKKQTENPTNIFSGICMTINTRKLSRIPFLKCYIFERVTEKESVFRLLTHSSDGHSAQSRAGSRPWTAPFCFSPWVAGAQGLALSYTAFPRTLVRSELEQPELKATPGRILASQAAALWTVPQCWPWAFYSKQHLEFGECLLTFVN